MFLYFYEILQSIMEEKNLTIPAVARLSGLPDSTIRSILARKNRTIALEVAFKLAKGLDVPIEELNGERGNATENALLAGQKTADKGEEAAENQAGGSVKFSHRKEQLLKEVEKLDEGKLSAVAAFIRYLGEAEQK